MGADGSGVLLEPRVVEVRQVDLVNHPAPGQWQRFLVSKRLVVERKAEPLGPLPADWLDALKAAWARIAGDRLLEQVTAFDSWDAQGRVRFVVRFQRLAAAEMRFTVDAGLATRVVRALLPHYVAYRGNAMQTPDGPAVVSAAQQAFKALNLTVTEARELMAAERGGA